MEEIRFNCKSCGRLLITPLGRAGKKGRCPHCGQVQLVPPPEPAASRDDDAGGCRYDAFISYRHVEPDRTWATWLHETLETYRTPRKLVAQGIAPRLKPVFRDEDELPASADLNKEIERALQQSRFLIVICSPRTPQSEWVNKEAIRFREMGRGDRILTLLIEGEPSQSFPRALREIRTRIAGEDGVTSERIDQVEPLAADVRPTRKEGMRHLKRMARLRMLACILGCSFDTLRQRERERRRRRRTIAGTVAALAAVVLAGLGIFAYGRVMSERRRAEAEQAKAAIAAREAQEQKKATDEQRLEAEQQRERAQAEALKATRQAEVAARSLYQGLIKQAYAAYVEGNVLRVEEILGRCPEKLRGWEWYWMRNGHRVFSAASQAPEEYVSVVAVSPDGGRAAVGAGTRLRVWEVATGKTLVAMSAQPDEYWCAAFSPDGSQLLAGNPGTGAALWDVKSGKKLTQLTRVEAEEVGFSDDGKWFFADDEVWDAKTGKQQTDGQGKPGGTCSVNDSNARQRLRGPGNAYSPVGRWNVLVRPGVLVVSREVDGTMSTASLPSPVAKARSIAFSHDGKRVIAGYDDGAVRIWEMIQGQQVQALLAHKAPVVRLAVSPDGTKIVSCDSGGGVRVWNLSASKNTWPIEDSYWAGTIRLLQNEKFLAVTAYLEANSHDDNLRVWDMRTGKALWPWDYNTRPHFLALSPDGRTAVVRNSKDRVSLSLYDVVAQKQTRPLPCDELVPSAEFSPDGRRVLLYPGPQGVIRVFDASTGAQLVSYAALPWVVPPWGGGVKDRLRSDGRSLVLANLDGKGGGSISVLDAFTGKTRSRYDIPAIEIQDFTGEGNADRMIAAFGAADSPEWYVCALADGTRLVRLQGQDLRLRYPTFGPGHRLIAAYNDRKDPAASDITVWNAATGDPVATLPGAGPAMAFSPDGSRLFTGGIDPSLKVWDIQTGTEIISLSGSGKIASVVTSNDGRRVFSADKGGVLVWDGGDR